MVSDGDSKAFNTVENIYYGDDNKVEKLGRVGHVQEHIDKHLLDLKARTEGIFADGKPIGGQGHLTENHMKCFQKYYGLAIRQNTVPCLKPSETQQRDRERLMLLFTP